MTIGPLAKVILYVRDMDAQVRFYRDALGLAVLEPAGRESYAGESWVALDAGSLVLALHVGGRGRIGEDAPKLAFSVADVTSARAALAARGVAMGEIRDAAPGVRVCDCADPEGNRFSLDERRG